MLALVLVMVVSLDRLRCGPERLRLLGIEPELESCPRSRVSVPGDGPSSKRSLELALQFERVRYQVVANDRYGRRVVTAWAGPINLSCWQLSHAEAVYKQMGHRRIGRTNLPSMSEAASPQAPKRSELAALRAMRQHSTRGPKTKFGGSEFQARKGRPCSLRTAPSVHQMRAASGKDRHTNRNPPKEPPVPSVPLRDLRVLRF